MNSILIFCSGAINIDGSFLTLAGSVGKVLGKKGCCLIYGGGGNGMMNALFEAYSEASDAKKYYSIVPESIANCSVRVKQDASKIVTSDLSDRKKVMLELSSKVVVLPGGIGTIDEFFHVIATKQLVDKSIEIILYNYNGFYDGLLKALHQIKKAGFIKHEMNDLFSIVDSIDGLEKLI